MSAINEIKQLKSEIQKMKSERNTFIRGANDKIGELRDELMNMYKINYQLLQLKQSVFKDIQPDIIKFNESCFSGRLMEEYKQKYAKIKDEIYYFCIFKGKANYLLLWLDNESIEEHSKTFELEYKVPSTFIEYNLIMSELKKSDGVSNLNFYKCDIKDINETIKLIKTILN